MRASRWGTLTPDDGVAQSVAHDVQAYQKHGEHAPRHQQYPGSCLHFTRALRNQRAEARMGLLDAEPQEAQKALEHNDLRYDQRRVDDDRTHQVRNNMPQDDAAGARSGGNRRFDELALTDAQCLAAHDTRHREPADGTAG